MEGLLIKEVQFFVFFKYNMDTSMTLKGPSNTMLLYWPNDWYRRDQRKIVFVLTKLKTALK